MASTVEPALSSREADAGTNRPAKPLKVLHVINGLGLGGAETLLYRMVTRDRTNHHVVVSIKGPAWYSPRLAEQGIEVHHLNMDTPAATPGGIVKLNKIIRRSDADIVQCWMYRSNLLGGIIAKAARKPVVWGIHCSSLEPLRPSSRALARFSGLVARWMPDFIINCSAQSATLHDSLGFSGAPGAVIHNGYDATEFFPDEGRRMAAREQLGLAPEDFAVGCIARWHRQKDIPNLLAAIRSVSGRGIPFRCFLIGTDLDAGNAQLARAIDRAGCGDLVTLLGRRADIADIARALDLHVLPSCGGEAFPNAVAETMLSGTPNVVTDVGDAPLLVENSGWVASPREEQQLAEAIIAAHHEWKDRLSDWQRRRQAARSRIVENFSIERMAQGYEDVWRTVTGTALSGPAAH